MAKEATPEAKPKRKSRTTKAPAVTKFDNDPKKTRLLSLLEDILHQPETGPLPAAPIVNVRSMYPYFTSRNMIQTPHHLPLGIVAEWSGIDYDGKAKGIYHKAHCKMCVMKAMGGGYWLFTAVKKLNAVTYGDWASGGYWHSTSSSVSRNIQSYTNYHVNADELIQKCRDAKWKVTRQIPEQPKYDRQDLLVWAANLLAHGRKKEMPEWLESADGWLKALLHHDRDVLANPENQIDVDADEPLGVNTLILAPEF